GPAAGPLKKVTTPTLIVSFADADPVVTAASRRQLANAARRSLVLFSTFIVFLHLFLEFEDAPTSKDFFRY
ncbi:MAG: hypothetical protein ACO3U3_01320, partial [Alphaproteobacteria bacterium]